MTRLFEAKPFIICELGSNWRTLADITNSVNLIKAMGADALKLQAFTGEDLYGFDDGPLPYSLPLEWLPAIKEKCDKAGLEFMCTAFSPELLAAVDPYVDIHKIASSDLSYPQLLDAAKKTGKPVILSTGASGAGDVRQALEHLDRAKTVLLYCNSAYPSTHHNLFQIDTMRERFQLPVGLSDHSLDAVYAPLAAITFHGAIVIEKHFTPIPEVDTPDRPHSLDATDFKIMCDHLRGKADTSDFQPTREEHAMMLRHNRRLVASKDIAAGEQLVFGKNYGAFRTLEDDAHGFSPFLWNNKEMGPEGRYALKAIAQGKGVGPGDY